MSMYDGNHRVYIMKFAYLKDRNDHCGSKDVNLMSEFMTRVIKTICHHELYVWFLESFQTGSNMVVHVVYLDHSDIEWPCGLKFMKRA
ncbi:5354_t:CDS:1, partial [Ambispora leptoticha]